MARTVAGRDERDSTSAPVPVPDYAATLPDDDDRAAAVLRGMRLGLPRQYFVKGMEPGVEARVREAVESSALIPITRVASPRSWQPATSPA